MYSQAIISIEERMQKTVEGLMKELSAIRTGRATPSLIEHIKIDYAGVPTALNQLAGISIPAREVGGDFYDYLVMGDSVAIVLADVTGKSVKAAMVAALADGMLHSEMESQREIWNSPKGILSKLNARLQPRLMRGMFTAISLGIICKKKLEHGSSTSNRKLLFSNAGMPYPIVRRGNDVWELEVTGMPLGLVGGAEYEDMSVELKAGDLVVFHSDGVIEATNEADEMYQTERLMEIVKQADPSLSAQEMVDLIVKDVTAFVGDIEPSDDITVVVIRCGK